MGTNMGKNEVEGNGEIFITTTYLSKAGCTKIELQLLRDED